MTAAAPQPGWFSSAPGASPAGRPDGAFDAVRADYTELFGTVPAGIEHRLALAGRAVPIPSWPSRRCGRR